MAEASIEGLEGYIRDTHGITLSAASSARVAQACERARRSLEAVASDSLFDSEPAGLQLTLDALARDPKA